jgi:DMSO reductase anchor subunit
MRPAASLILFTTFAGAGFGALLWLGLELLQGAPPTRLDLAAAGFAAVLGLLASVAHLGKPLRAWRALTQWRSSWLSREAWAAMACLLLALLIGLGIVPSTRAIGLPLAAFAGATLWCTAMIYHSLPPIPAWRIASVPAIFVTLGLYSGGYLLLALNPARGYEWAAFCAVLAIIPATQKLRYWRMVDEIQLPEAAAALGLSAGSSVANFEAPHTETNYLLREYVYQVARQHRRRLRMLCLVTAFVAAPAMALLIIVWPSLHAPLAWSGWLLLMAGLMIERWLFFAEARHVVERYYRPED